MTEQLTLCRESGAEANSDLPAGDVVFDDEPYATVALAVHRWFALLAAKQLKKVGLIERPF